jgi:hypothetical protein
MRTPQIDRPISPMPAALYADDQAVDPIAKAALVLTHFEHRYLPCRDHLIVAELISLLICIAR